MAMPALFGFLAQILGTDVFPYYVGLLFAVFLVSMFLLIHALKKRIWISDKIN